MSKWGWRIFLSDFRFEQRHISERGGKNLCYVFLVHGLTLYNFFSLLFCVLIILALPERETALILTYVCDTGLKGFNTIMI